MDEKKFYDDFIHLTRDVGIFMYDDLISILSVRNQAIHILQVRKQGYLWMWGLLGLFAERMMNSLSIPMFKYVFT